MTYSRMPHDNKAHTTSRKPRWKGPLLVLNGHPAHAGWSGVRKMSSVWSYRAIGWQWMRQVMQVNTGQSIDAAVAPKQHDQVRSHAKHLLMSRHCTSPEWIELPSTRDVVLVFGLAQATYRAALLLPSERGEVGTNIASSGSSVSPSFIPMPYGGNLCRFPHTCMLILSCHN